MCGAIGEPGPTWAKVGDMRLTADSGIERWTGSEWIDAQPAVDWDRIERFVVTIPVDGGYQSQSVGKEAVTAVLTDGYTVERYQRPSLAFDKSDEREPYPTGRGMWSIDEIKRITRETIGEYGLVPNNYDQVERGPVTGVSEKAGDATDDLTRVEYGIGVKPPVPQQDATDGESRPPTPGPQGIEWDIDRNLPVYTRDLYELGKHWRVSQLPGRTLRDVIENFAAGYGRTPEGG
jgi:hypothetical protein